MLHLWRLRNGASSVASSLQITKQNYLSAAQAISRPTRVSVASTTSVSLSSIVSPGTSSCFFSTDASSASSSNRRTVSKKERYKKIDQWRKTHEKARTRSVSSPSSSSPSFNVRPDAVRSAKKAEKAARREAYVARKAAGDEADPWYSGETLKENGGVNAATAAAVAATAGSNSNSSAGASLPKRERPINPKRKFHEPKPSDSNHPSSQFFTPFKDQVLPGQASFDAAAISADTNALLATSFNELHVPPHVVGKLQSGLGITHPTPIQNAAIPFLMNSPFFQLRNRGLGALPQNEPHASQMTERDLAAQQRRRAAAKLPTPRDMLIQDMTGCGKTLAYALPMLSLIDNFSRQTQGLVIAPTRELAVQIHRNLLKLNQPSKGGKNKKRRTHPIIIELAIGNVDRAYAASVRKHRPHIIVATPQAAQALIMPPSTDIPSSSSSSSPSVSSSTNSSRLRSFGTISLAHLRMLVLDEVDHLLLPFSAPGMERFLQFYTSSRTHGSFHRMGRIVAVSAAISQRVHHLGKKWLNRPVTATPRGVFNGWVKSEHMLRDKFYLPREEAQESNSIPTPATEQSEETAAVVDKDDVEEDADDDQAADVPLSADINPVEVEKVSQFVVDKELSEPYEMVEEDDDVTYGESDEDETSEAEETRRFLREEEEVLRDEDGNVPESSIVRADEFKLPGVGAAPVAVSLHATLEPEAKQAATTSATTEEPVAPSVEEPIDEAVSSSLDVAPPLPADEQTLRFLPPTMKHFVVHVNPEVKISPYRLTKPETKKGPHVERKSKKPNAAAIDAAEVEIKEPTAEELEAEAKEAKAQAESDREYQHALHSKATLLSQLHSVLKPRVALVFFNRASEAEEVARELRKSKGMKSALLLGGTAYDSDVRVSALEAAMRGSVPFVFATDLASRGLDIKGLSHVINFDPPKTALDYIHRAGRVERLGGKVGCSVITVIKDARVTPKAAKGKPESRPSLYIGPQVFHMQKLVAQLHLKSVAQEVELKRGEFAPFVPPSKPDETVGESKPEAATRASA